MLFLTIYGSPFAADSLSRLVTGYVKKSEIGKKGSCHLFRHSMATRMLENVDGGFADLLMAAPHRSCWV